MQPEPIRDEPPTRQLNVNIKAVIWLTAIVVVAVVVMSVIQFRTGTRLRDTALAEARRQVNEGQVDRAVRNLEAILASNPKDVEVLEMEAKVLAEKAQTIDQLLNAAACNDRFVRFNPEAPGAQDARRRTADLYIRFGDLYLDSPYYRNIPETSAFNMRSRAAVAVAQSLIDNGAKDAGAYLLLARAEEHLALTGDQDMLGQSIKSYEQVLEIDPDNLLGTERLANLLIDKKQDRVRAIRLLDKLLKRRPRSASLRLVRLRFFVKRNEDARATAEMDALLKLAPNDPLTYLEAADMHLRRLQTAEARRFVDKIPASWRDDLRVRLVRGLIELNENHPEDAMEIWRKGLISSRGSDAMLTWNLAYSLLQLGRLEEAGRLIAQYRRLTDDESSPMLNLLLGIHEQKTGRSLKASSRLEELRERIDPRWRQLLDSTLGRCYGDIGDLSRSALAYRRVLQENPKSVIVRVELADALTNSRPQEAAELIEAGLQYFPDEPSFWVTLASALLRNQENSPSATHPWDKFDKAMERAVQLAPDHPLLTTIRSRRQSLEGKTESATAILEEALRRDPHKPKLWETYVDALLKAGRPGEALAVLDRASSPQAIGETIGVRLARFSVLETLGRARQAREQLTRNVDTLPMDQRGRVWETLGRDLDSKGDVSGAREVYIKWAEQIPEDVRPRLALLDMAIYNRGEDGRTASAAIRRLGKIGDEPTLLEQARGLIQQESEESSSSTTEESRLREAERILETVRAVDPQSPALYALQGELSERRGLIGDAIQAYRQAWGRGGEAILPHLVDLLARTSPGELERLGTTNSSPKLVRLVIQAFFKLGQPERAAKIAAEDRRAIQSAEAIAWRVELLGNLGRPDLAEELLRADTSLRAELIEPWIALIRCQAGQGHSEAAIASLEEARKAIKDPRTHFVNAQLHRAARDRVGADREFQTSLAELPTDLEVLFEASEFAEENSRSVEVEAHLVKILTLDPSNRKAARKLALHLVSRPFDQAGWDRAWATLGPDSAVNERPEDRLVRAIVLSKGPRPDHRQQALARLESLVADMPGESRAMTTARGLLARLNLDSNRADRTVQLLGPGIEHGDDSAASLALYVEALLRLGRYDDAREQLDRFAKVTPGDDRQARLKARLVAAEALPGEVGLDLERSLTDLGDAPEAKSFGREAFALLVTANPPIDESAERIGYRLATKDAKASWMPAMIAGRQGRATEALRLCQAAVEVADPADAREACRVAVGVTLADPTVDHHLELESILNAGALRDPDGVEIPLQLAQLRHRQARYEDEVRLYREVMGRRPELRPSIQNNLAWILCENLQKPGEAIVVVDDLLKSNGRIPAVLDTRGVILTRLGRPIEAIMDLEESHRISNDPVCLFHLARAYRDAGKLNEYARCRDLIRQAKLTPESVEPSERAELANMIRP